MKLSIKTLKNIIYNIDTLNDEISIIELKQKIEDQTKLKKNEIKLVFNGQVLEDSKKLLDYKILNNNTIVLMIVTVNIKPQNKEEAKSVELTKKETKNDDLNGKNIISNDNNSDKKEKLQIKENIPYLYENELKELNTMGFHGDSAKFVLSSTQGNINTAIDLLSEGGNMNGLDQDNIEEFNYSGNEEAENEGDEGLDEDAQNQAFLGEEDQEVEPIDEEEKLSLAASIAKIMCQDDKSKLTDVISQLQTSYPEMLEIINEYNEEFEELFNAPITSHDREIYKKYMESVRLSEEIGEGISQVTNNEFLQPNLDSQIDNQETFENNEIILSESDIESVNRLVTLGFSFKDSKYAYLVCDKNEELAANFLIENRLKESK